MKLYDKSDLLKLKDSKPVPIIAHSHELVVPVVYAEMTKKYLENKGITLPLTHKQLMDMKHEAQSLAVGGKVKKKRIIKKKDANIINRDGQVAQQKVIIHLGERKKSVKKRNPIKKKGEQPSGAISPYQPPPSTPNPLSSSRMNIRPDSFYANLNPIRSNNFDTIRPFSTTFAANTPFFKEDAKSNKEAEESLKRERAGLDEYKKEIERRLDQTKELEKAIQKNLELNRPIRKDPEQIPVRDSRDQGSQYEEEERKINIPTIKEPEEEEDRKQEAPGQPAELKEQLKQFEKDMNLEKKSRPLILKELERQGFKLSVKDQKNHIEWMFKNKDNIDFKPFIFGSANYNK
jgi:hypothetical protein